MKFSFEKARDTFKKTAKVASISAGVVGASLGQVSGLVEAPAEDISSISEKNILAEAKKRKEIPTANFLVEQNRMNTEINGQNLPEDTLKKEKEQKEIQFNLMSKALNERYKHLNWVQRGLSPDNYPKIEYVSFDKSHPWNKFEPITDLESDYIKGIKETPYPIKESKTHLLSWQYDDEGCPFVFPMIIQNEENGELFEFKDKGEAFNYAQRTKTGIKIPNIEFAEFYIKHGFESRDFREFSRDEYLKYMTHPSYKSRLAMEMFGTENLLEEQKKELEEAYQLKIERVKNVKIFKSNEEMKGEYIFGNVVASEYSLPHELTHVAESRKDIITDGGDKVIFSSPSNIEEENGEGFMEIYKKYISENFKEKDTIPSKYFSSPSEIKARINHLRIKAIREHQYDQSQPFDVRNYPSFKEDRQYQQLIENAKMSEEQINEFAKYIAGSLDSQSLNIV